MKDSKEELINDLIFLTSRKEDLWLYHPNNMEGMNLIAEYERVCKQIDKLQGKIKES
tara:strand:+ start:2071 stop:2241 length:171 start_codon:yes stop_codon:yes gene_type:complete